MLMIRGLVRRYIAAGLEDLKSGRLDRDDKEEFEKGIEVCRRRIEYDEQHFELLDEMDRLLTQEREEGWDWEKGIKEQYEVRERQAAISEKIIAESNDL